MLVGLWQHGRLYKYFNDHLYELELKNQNLLIFNFAKMNFGVYFQTVAREGCTFRKFHALAIIQIALEINRACINNSYNIYFLDAMPAM